MYKEISFTTEPATYSSDPSALIATITLNRPRRGNAITPLMAEEVLDALKKCESDPLIRVLCLTGSGKYFCTGMDMQQALTNADNEPGNQTNFFQSFFHRLHTTPLPTICLLNGPAMGGGVGLFCLCDIRVAQNTNDYLALSEVKRGLVPALISPYVLKALGSSHAVEMMVTGGRVSTQDLLKFGVLSAIAANTKPWCVPFDKSSAISQESLETLVDLKRYYSRMLIEAAPKAVGLVKQLAYDASSDEEAKKRVRKVFDIMMSSEEASYGMQSFLSRENPVWSKL